MMSSTGAPAVPDRSGSEDKRSWSASRGDVPGTDSSDRLLAAEDEARLEEAIAGDPTRWVGITTMRPNDRVRRVAHDTMRRVALEPTAMDWDSPLAELLTSDVGRYLRELYRLPPSGDVAYTGGSSESIFLALLCAREKARAAGLDPSRMRVLRPTSGHPAIDKAAHYLGLRLDTLPLDEDLRCDLDALEASIDRDTVAVVGALPSDCHGVCDPIPEMAAICAERGVWFHLDGAIGGCLVPYLKNSCGLDLPNCDFSLPGLSSVTVGLHKYGYAPIGIAAVLFRDRDDGALRRVDMTAWDGYGRYGDRFDGLKSLDTLAGAWATIRMLGHDGYARRAGAIARNMADFASAVRAVPGMKMLTEPNAGLAVFDAASPKHPEFARRFAERGHRGKPIRSPGGFVVCIGPERGAEDLAYYCREIEVVLKACATR